MSWGGDGFYWWPTANQWQNTQWSVNFRKDVLWFGLQGFIFKTINTNHLSYLHTNLEVGAQVMPNFYNYSEYKILQSPGFVPIVEIVIANFLLILISFFRKGAMSIKATIYQTAWRERCEKCGWKTTPWTGQEMIIRGLWKVFLPSFPKVQEVFLGEMVVPENHIIPGIVETSGQHMWL